MNCSTGFQPVASRYAASIERSWIQQSPQRGNARRTHSLTRWLNEARLMLLTYSSHGLEARATEESRIMNTLAVILARAGSAGLKNKHLLPLLGRPVISYTLEHARQAKR